jgi:hypothetical protein
MPLTIPPIAETCDLCGTTTADTYHTINNGVRELNYCSYCRDYQRDRDTAGMLHDGPLLSDEYLSRSDPDEGMDEPPVPVYLPVIDGPCVECGAFEVHRPTCSAYPPVTEGNIVERAAAREAAATGATFAPAQPAAGHTATDGLTCIRCGHTKPASEFYRNSREATGYSTHCKACGRTRRQTLGTALSETRTFGVEIECFCRASRATVARRLREAGIDAYDEHYGHHDNEYWKIVTDATVQSHTDGEGVYWHGMEIVSPGGDAALKGASGVVILRKVVKVLKRLGSKTSNRCGLHVHQYARDLPLAAFKNVTKLYLKHEEAFDSIMPESRRGPQAARTNCGVMAHGLMDPEYLGCRHYDYQRGRYEDMTKGQMFECIDRCDDVYEIANLWVDRYLKLNLYSFSVHGTIEFRHFGGTLDIEKMVNWVALTGAIVNNAAQMRFTVRGRVSLKVVFTVARVTPRTRRFFEQRAAAMEAR